MNLLHPGDEFPALEMSLPGGGTLGVPKAFHGDYAVVMFFRGSWCPYCSAQLRSFQRALPRLLEADIRLAAASVDEEATTATFIDEHGLTFPVGYGLDATATSEATGAFVNDEPRYLQTSGFLLDPAGRVLVSVYSSGAIGQFVPTDVLSMVRYAREHA